MTSYLNFSFHIVLLNCLTVITFLWLLLILMPKILIKKMIRIGLFQRLTLCYLEKKVEQREMGIGTLVVSSVLRILRVQSTYLTLTKKRGWSQLSITHKDGNSLDMLIYIEEGPYDHHILFVRIILMLQNRDWCIKKVVFIRDSCQIKSRWKVQIFWEGHKNLKKKSHVILKLPIM